MKKEEERLSDRILNGELQDYEFDMEAVHHLEKEREWMQWLVIVVIGFLMAVIGITGKSASVLFYDINSCVQYNVSTTWLFYLTVVCLY